MYEQLILHLTRILLKPKVGCTNAVASDTPERIPITDNSAAAMAHHCQLARLEQVLCLYHHQQLLELICVTKLTSAAALCCSNCSFNCVKWMFQWVGYCGMRSNNGRNRCDGCGGVRSMNSIQVAPVPATLHVGVPLNHANTVSRARIVSPSRPVPAVSNYHIPLQLSLQ